MSGYAVHAVREYGSRALWVPDEEAVMDFVITHLMYKGIVVNPIKYIWIKKL